MAEVTKEREDGTLESSYWWKKYNSHFIAPHLAESFAICLSLIKQYFSYEGVETAGLLTTRRKETLWGRKELINKTLKLYGFSEDTDTLHSCIRMFNKITSDLVARPSIIYTIQEVIGKKVGDRYFAYNLQDINDDIDIVIGVISLIQEDIKSLISDSLSQKEK